MDSRFFMEDCPSSVSIVGKSKAMMQTLRMVRLVAQSNCNPVLIVGETGTGKELLPVQFIFSATRPAEICSHQLCGSDSQLARK